MRFANKRDCKLKDGYKKKDKEAVASGHPFQRYCAPLKALHHCSVKTVMYHSRATFKEALKQVICFSK